MTAGDQSLTSPVRMTADHTLTRKRLSESSCPTTSSAPMTRGSRHPSHLSPWDFGGWEYLWRYLRSLFGFPSWRAVRRWRVVELAGLNFWSWDIGRRGGDTTTVVRLCKGKLQKLWLEDADQGMRAHPAPWWGCGMRCFGCNGVDRPNCHRLVHGTGSPDFSSFSRGHSWAATIEGVLGELRAAMADVAVTLDGTVSGLKGACARYPRPLSHE
jgi:hypothetical protein